MPLTLDDLSAHQLLFYFNPLFDGGQQIVLTIPTCITSLVFFDGLYLRWYNADSCKITIEGSNISDSIYYAMFPALQEICFSQLLSYRISCGLDRVDGSNNGSHSNKSISRERSCTDTGMGNSLDSFEHSETEL